ncbi:hypothetical protein TNCV_466671 [Trichonephila clavipes]|nr:hypothetical protein TNCV_466671 [Trichonephila clavipes]
MGVTEFHQQIQRGDNWQDGDDKSLLNMSCKHLVCENSDNSCHREDDDPDERGSQTNAVIWSTVAALRTSARIQISHRLGRIKAVVPATVHHQNAWFTPHGPPAHFSIEVRNHLRASYPERWIGRGSLLFGLHASRTSIHRILLLGQRWRTYDLLVRH